MTILKRVNEDIQELLEIAADDGRFDEEARADKAEALGWGCMCETDGYDLTADEKAAYWALVDIRNEALEAIEKLNRKLSAVEDKLSW